MDAFARCFLLVFAQLYIGGLLALSVPPFQNIERGYYKSTAAVYLGIGVVALAGRLALLLRPVTAARATLPAQYTEIVLWSLSLAAAGFYLHSLWGDNFHRRARAYVLAWMSGVGAMLVGAQSFRLSPFVSIETVLYPLSFLVSALLLGAVVNGMMLGHWYLIEHNMAIEPFRRVFRFFAIMLGLQAALLLLAGVAFRVVGASASAAAVADLLHSHGSLLTVRLLLSPIAAAGLAWMIWKTLQIPQTMAATGLFYIAILSVLVGEFMSRFILFRTSLPL